MAATANEGAVAVAGWGIVSTGYFGRAVELAEGRLTELLTDWQMGAVDVHAVFAAGHAAKPAARAFVDFLVTSFKDTP